MDLATIRYPRILDAFEEIFKKERNETFETHQLLSRRQREGESLEQFHSVLKGLAAICSLGTLERRILRDVFIVNMTNKEAQTKIYRSTKTPYEVYKIALSYEWGNKYAKSYKITGGGLHARRCLTSKGRTHRSIRGGFRRPSQRGSKGLFQGNTRGGAEKRCFNGDRANFTTEQTSKRPARNATCNYCKKTGRGKRGAKRGRVELIHGKMDRDDQFAENDDVASRQDSSVGWVNICPPQTRGWGSDSSEDYIVMSIKKNKVEREFKVARYNCH